MTKIQVVQLKQEILKEIVLQKEASGFGQLLCIIYKDMILNKIPNNRYEILNNQYKTEEENSHPLSIVMKTLMNSQAQ